MPLVFLNYGGGTNFLKLLSPLGKLEEPLDPWQKRGGLAEAPGPELENGFLSITLCTAAALQLMWGHRLCNLVAVSSHGARW